MQNIPSASKQSIPFNQLVAWRGNVRRTGSGDGIESLAASIDAHGLLQPIVVRDGGDGRFPVIAGHRRFLALQHMVENGKFSSDAPVACTIVDGSSDDTEISLVENAMQLPMHPADKFEAFRDLADKGMAASDIAARFGVAESSVFKLMKLGRVSPEVMQAYRDNKIEYAQVQAFTISDDVAAQNHVLEMVLNAHYRLSPDVNGFHNATADIAHHANQLAAALNLDMRKWFTATAENTFNRISRKQIVEAYTEATGELPSNAVLGLKKKELAIRAERDIGDKWLPSVLRQQATPVQEGADDE